MSDPPRVSAPGWVRRGLTLGLAVGFLLGLLEAGERMWALRGFLRGAGEGAWLAGLVFFFPMLVGALLGLCGGALVALAVALRRTLSIPAALWRALCGGALGAGLTAFGLFALTLTTRFDAVIARGPLLLVAASVAGIIAGLAAVRLATLAPHLARGNLRGALLVAAALGVLVVYFENTYFAPHSSYGIHVILLAMLAGSAALVVLLTPLSRMPLGVPAVMLLVLALPADLAMRERPRLEYLVKLRTSTSARCVDLLSTLMDFDRDGFAPRFLVGGMDVAPFDPSRPPPVLERAIPSPPVAADSPAVSAAHPASAPAPAPHILLLTLDACRADAVAPAPPSPTLLGAPRPPTPVLDSLAARSVVFDAAYTPSAGTEDTFHSLFAGDFLPGILLGTDPARYLAARLQRRGYAVRAWADDSHFARSPWGFPSLATCVRPDARRMLLDAAEFLATLPEGQPGFVWIHVMDLHSEVLNPLSLNAYLRSRKVSAYVRALGHVDSLVGTLLDAFRREGIAGRTLIVVSADHGEEFGEHGHFHHNLALYEPAIRVPLWISGPGVVPRAVHRTVSLEDIYPTLLEAAGIDPGPTPVPSLWPLLTGSPDRRLPSTFYSFLPHRGYSTRFAGWDRPEHGQAALVDLSTGHKVILRFLQETWEAYDLRRDPLESNDRAGDPLGWPDSMLTSLKSVVERYSKPTESP